MDRKFNIGDVVQINSNIKAIVKLSYNTSNGGVAYALEIIGKHTYWPLLTKEVFLNTRKNIIGDVDSLDFKKLSFLYEYALKPVKKEYIDEDE